jgi:hypothetical protein
LSQNGALIVLLDTTSISRRALKASGSHLSLHLFLSNFAVLQMGKRIFFWPNPQPSTRYVDEYIFSLKKKIADVPETEYMEEQISNLLLKTIEINKQNFKISHNDHR